MATHQYHATKTPIEIHLITNNFMSKMNTYLVLDSVASLPTEHSNQSRQHEYYFSNIVSLYTYIPDHKIKNNYTRSSQKVVVIRGVTVNNKLTKD